MKENERFEIDCVSYLTRTYGNEAVRFIHLGKHDANVPDIETVINGSTRYYIEAKMASAQCGQFVLQPDNLSRTFIYSAKSMPNTFTSQIQSYMNLHYEEFAAAGTRGRAIELDKSVFYNWVKCYYAQKGVSFFITKGRDFIIFPLDCFEEYFDISAVYRCKRSGSCPPTVNNRPELERLLSALQIPYTLNLGRQKGAFVQTACDLTNRYMQGPFYEYLFRHDSGNTYKIRRLSNTRNSNVIFQIQLKQEQNPAHLKKFQCSLL